MEGDLTLGALGTVTWTDEAGRLLAFGHPFMQNGDSDLFLNRAWIVGCIPNLSSSYKIGNIGPCVGRITQDRAGGVAGTVGRPPSSVPVHISVRDRDRSQATQSRLRIVTDERVFPAALDAAVVNVAAKTVDRGGGGTASVAFAVEGRADAGEALVLHRDNMFYAANDLMKGMEQELSETVDVLMNNKLAKVDLTAVSVSIDIYREPRVAEIVRAKVRQNEAAPGEEILLDVTLKPYRGEEREETVAFTVPKEYKGKRLDLAVRGGSSMAWARQLLRKQQEESIPDSEKKDVGKTLQDFVKEVEKADKNNQLIVDILPSAPKTGAGAPSPGGEAALPGLLAGSPYKIAKELTCIVDGETQTVVKIKKAD